MRGLGKVVLVRNDSVSLRLKEVWAGHGQRGGAFTFLKWDGGEEHPHS